jgi:hypothetical protein
MKPELSINYNSNSGNGLLGVGFGLGGLSAIHRCSKTIAIDVLRSWNHPYYHTQRFVHFWFQLSNDYP